MQLGKVIRKYRKEKNMTQEEMAGRLGVTAPAVNKWENGNSFPDIMLLAPIARLLDISLDTLLAFREELTAEEIREIIFEADRKLKETSFEEAFQWGKKVLEQYPNCDQLTWQIAAVFGAQLIIREITDSEKYEEYLISLYERVLESRDETIRSRAADSLFSLYVRKEQYEKAEEYLKYFSIENPERKRKQAQIYSAQGRSEEAYRAYEELLFADYQMLSLTLHGIYMLALQEKNMEKAHLLVRKQEEAAKCFEMGKYYEVSCRLELALMEKDTETAVSTMQEMLASVEQLGDFSKSRLYEHMSFHEPRKEFQQEIKENLLKCFRDEESCGFLKDDPRWQELIGQR